MVMLSSAPQGWPVKVVQHRCYTCFAVINSRDWHYYNVCAQLFDIELSVGILNSRCVFKDRSRIGLIVSIFDLPSAVVQVASEESKSCVGLLNSLA